MKKTKIILLAGIIFFTACKKSNDYNTTTTTGNSTTARTASFKIGSNVYTVNKPYVGVFNNNGTVYNTLTLTATDGSKTELNFTGSAPATYTLQSYSDAYYKNASGKQYNATGGQLTTTAYTTNGVTHKITGTFHFKAKAITAPIDSIEITDGVITGASNEL